MELADAMALCNNNNNWMNNPFMYLVWMCLFGGDGFGWNRNNNEGLTQTELQAGFNNQDVMRGLEGIKMVFAMLLMLQILQRCKDLTASNVTFAPASAILNAV